MACVWVAHAAVKKVGQEKHVISGCAVRCVLNMVPAKMASASVTRDGMGSTAPLVGIWPELPLSINAHTSTVTRCFACLVSFIQSNRVLGGTEIFFSTNEVQ